MNKAVAFEPLATLTTSIWSSDKMKNEWKWSDRSMEAVIQRFVDLNSKGLDFLGISAKLITDGLKPALQLTTSKYVGTVPIKSPMNGKYEGDLSVRGRFGEDAAELIPLLGDHVRIEYNDKLRLSKPSAINPPIYIECCKYIDAFIEAQRYRWRKFNNVVLTQQQSSSATLWKEYATRVAKDPSQFCIFKNKCNVLSTNHKEWRQLTYILTLAMKELLSHNVPIRTRVSYSDRIQYLNTLTRELPIEQTNDIQIHMSDPVIIKKIKKIGIAILNSKSNQQIAWRMDYAEFFERFVQYLFSNVAKRKNATTYENAHYHVTATKLPSWGLSYLEPDLLIRKDETEYVVDAKYKSHLYNFDNESEDLKDTFRHDLHQVLAYSAFNSMKNKKVVLAYPFSDFALHKMQIRSNISSTTIDVYLVGIPIERRKIDLTETEIERLMMI